jgi:predicted RNA methylase
MTDLIPRATLAEIAAGRNRALTLFGEAHDMIEAANAKMREASDALRAAAPTANLDVFRRDDRVKLFGSYQVAGRDEFMSMARHMVDADVWTHVVNATDLQRLMDKKAKDKLREQLITDPAEFTLETVAATLQAFAADAGTIFRRGIAEVFSNLDRRFRSHDGFKVGSRVIITYAFDGFGYWNYHRDHRATLQDIERTFHVLEGKPVPLDYAGVIGAIDDARRQQGGFHARQTEVETEYYLVRIFKNGNVHLWFKRRDLVEKVNKLLAECYGEVIPDGQTPEDDGGLHESKRELARNFGFFPSPQPVVDRVIEEAGLWRREDDPPLEVLEPSAGTGNIATAAVDKGADVDCIEVQAEHFLSLRQSGRYRHVRLGDFLKVPQRAVYDRVLMNPPFDRERDIDHVMHALGFLKPKGKLVSVMSAHTEFAETRKASAFRAHIKKLGGRMLDLPARSFSEVGTNVNTILLTVSA